MSLTGVKSLESSSSVALAAASMRSSQRLPKPSNVTDNVSASEQDEQDVYLDGEPSQTNICA